MKSNEEEVQKVEKKKHTALKITLIIIGILLLIVIILGIIGYIFISKNREEIIEKNSSAIINSEEIIEYGTTLEYNDILEKLVKTDDVFDNTNIIILINGEPINENDKYVFDSVENVLIKVEMHTKIASFLNEEEVVNKEITWKVEDNKKPILEGVQDKEVTIGEEFDIKAGISARDEVDGELELIIEGEYDINKAGEYILNAKAIDKNGNEVAQEFKLTIKEKPVEEVVTTNSNNSSNSSSKTSSSKTNNTSSNNTNSNTNASSSNTTPADPTSTKEGRLSLAKAEASRVVSRIITSGMSGYDKAKAICDYIYETVDVQTDQSNEAYKTNYGNEAYAALIMKIAACSGRCRAVTLLCNAAGLNSQHINAGEWTHQWNKIEIEPGKWVVIDSQIDFIGDRHPLE